MTIPSPWLGLLCGLLPTGLPFAAAGGVPASRAQIMRDVPYVAGATGQQRLDLYLPAATGDVAHDNAPRPLVIWIHGGGWESGDRRDCPALPLVERGYAVASVDYRLTSQAIFPAQIEDCKAAVRFLRAGAAQYRIDPARVGVWGASAGGHLAALLGTTAGSPRFDVGAHLDQSSAVQCVLDWFGPSDFLHWGDAPADPGLDAPDTALSRLLGGPVHTHEALARAASPVYTVDEHSAPFLILHGDADPIVPLQQSRVLQDVLRAAGVESTLRIIKGAGHGGPQFSQPENVALMVDFFDRHLRPADAR